MLIMLVSLLVEDTNGTVSLLSVLYAAASLTYLILNTGIRKILVFDVCRSALLTLAGTLLFHFMAILFGAPLVRSIERTARFSLLLSLMTVTPASVFLKFDSDKWFRLFLLWRPLTMGERLLIVSSVGAVVGAWLGAFVIPLDWERPWQVWPISCVVGAVAGHLVACTVGAIGLLAYKFYCRERTKLL
ncbi:phosphatidylinositol-glycan biosynthesis class F protein-like [Corticium candelabrum]|uniref:phosphatidylinositol-glycan biosynthesis class F protein-like n=1 Tax=Corticium candelabrum TaxID=121492 RepID=UPI002E253313|nr:phosphatidylinositol-glycan biosynthesis class F protein-like [Corticium candelabrum]